MHVKKTFLSRLCASVLAAGSLLTTAMATPAVVTAEDGLRLRSEASTSSSVLATLSNGTEVEVLDTVDEEWYQVSYNDRVGYLSSQYVQLGEDPVPKGVVTASSLNLRAEPSTEADVIARLSMGASVTLLGEAEGEWYHVSCQDKEGYVSGQYVALDNEKFAVVTASSLNVRATPSTDAEKVSTLASGEQVKILEELDGWLRIDGGYISAEYVSILDGTATARQAEIVAYAKSFLGCAYIYGATGPKAFDCSGLVYYVYKHFGYSLNRGATGQLRNGTPVNKSDLMPGDLVFFNSKGTGVNKASHIGIYIGGGQFIHASAPGVGVVISDLYSSYYLKVYTTARRIV